MKFREVLDGGLVERIRYGEDEHAVGPQQPAHILKRRFDGRRHVLEYLAREHEIVLAEFGFGRMGDVQARLAVEERVVVVELFLQALGVDFGIADADAVQAADEGKGRQNQASAE